MHLGFFKQLKKLCLKRVTGFYTGFPTWLDSWRDITWVLFISVAQVFCLWYLVVSKLLWNWIHFDQPILLCRLVLPQTSKSRHQSPVTSHALTLFRAPLSQSFKRMHQIWITYWYLKCTFRSRFYWERGRKIETNIWVLHSKHRNLP